MIENDPVCIAQDPQSNSLECNLASTLARSLFIMSIHTVFRWCPSFQGVDNEGRKVAGRLFLSSKNLVEVLTRDAVSIVRLGVDIVGDDVTR